MFYPIQSSEKSESDSGSLRGKVRAVLFFILFELIAFAGAAVVAGMNPLDPVPVAAQFMGIFISEHLFVAWKDLKELKKQNEPMSGYLR